MEGVFVMENLWIPVNPTIYRTTKLIEEPGSFDRGNVPTGRKRPESSPIVDTILPFGAQVLEFRENRNANRLLCFLRSITSCPRETIPREIPVSNVTG